MELLTEKSEFYQVFTHPDVYGFMWSIDPRKRNDLVYKYLMKEFKTDLSDIPWARTGLPYLLKNGTPDLYTKKHHSYVEIINDVMLDELESTIKSGDIEYLGIFNMNNIDFLLKLMKKFPINNLYFSERIIWLSSLSVMLKEMNINKEHTSNINSKTSKIYTMSLLAEFLVRKIK